ncbi:MAG: hypothetical protein E3K33_06665 [Candidatus Brocadia sp.]|nr:hypothetical protein [Candidatus Brocadia sp.]
MAIHSAAQPQPDFLYESGEIASEKALAMTLAMHFDGTLHVVIASEAKQSFTHKKRYLLKGVCEKTHRKKKFLYSNTIQQQLWVITNMLVHLNLRKRLVFLL